MLNCHFIIFTLYLLRSIASQRNEPFLSEEVDPKFWLEKAKNQIKLSLSTVHGNEGQQKAKNAILFLGDGMGVSTVTALRHYKSQMKDELAGRNDLAWEDFSYSSLIKTFDLERITTDSAASATAYLTGTKTRTSMTGVTGDVQFKNCETYDKKYDTTSVAMHALEAGLSVGLITTTRVTHASPAALYGHSPSRQWENDVETKGNCLDLATQLINNAINFSVIIGGGNSNFYQDSDTLTEKGNRKDGKNLLEKWINDQKAQNRAHKLITNWKELKDLDTSQVDYLLAMPEKSHFSYEKETERLPLSTLVQKGVEILKKNPKGFFLFVEGGLIDVAHHYNKAKKALDEGLEFEKAVIDTYEMVDKEETMILVTADHSHTLTIAGYPTRNTNILGITGIYKKDFLIAKDDNKPYTILGYINGPSAKPGIARENLTNVDTQSNEFEQPSLVPLNKETHGGEDVPIYANGPFSFLFSKIRDNTFIPYSISAALCIGDFQDLQHCR